MSFALFVLYDEFDKNCSRANIFQFVFYCSFMSGFCSDTLDAFLVSKKRTRRAQPVTRFRRVCLVCVGLWGLLFSGRDAFNPL